MSPALQKVKQAELDLVIIDGNTECESSEAARRINKLAPKVKVAVLADSKDLISAIESGAIR